MNGTKTLRVTEKLGIDNIQIGMIKSHTSLLNSYIKLL